MKILGLLISKQGFSPYGMGWWGIKVAHHENTYKSSNLGYHHGVWVTLSLGTRRASDGYQVANVTRAYGFILRWGTIVEEPHEECPDCEGGGFRAELHPSGHTEVKCEECEGTGEI